MVRIVVVGGGSAGWTTASYIKNSIDCELTVIHEEQNNPIGVGETVTPTLRLIAENANISENVWLKDSDATFKYGIKFEIICVIQFFSKKSIFSLFWSIIEKTAFFFSSNCPSISSSF